jgi:hypothetical protein
MFNFSGHTDAVLLLGMGSLFACAAFIPDNKLMGSIATAMSLGLGVVAFGLAFLLDPIVRDTPAPVIWTVIPLIGITGVLSK